MQGTRLFKTEEDDDFIYTISKTSGAYGTIDGKDWFCNTPNGLLGNLSSHTVLEFEDGSITVIPSILVSSGSNHAEPKWHGFLEHGIWREC